MLSTLHVCSTPLLAEGGNTSKLAYQDEQPRVAICVMAMNETDRYKRGFSKHSASPARLRNALRKYLALASGQEFNLFHPLDLFVCIIAGAEIVRLYIASLREPLALLTEPKQVILA